MAYITTAYGPGIDEDVRFSDSVGVSFASRTVALRLYRFGKQCQVTYLPVCCMLLTESLDDYLLKSRMFFEIAFHNPAEKIERMRGPLDKKPSYSAARRFAAENLQARAVRRNMRRGRNAKR